MGMFLEIEKKKRKELILLYKKYISNQNDPQIEKLIEEYTFNTADPIFSKDINSAGWNATKMDDKKLSVKDAIKILNKLKT